MPDSPTPGSQVRATTKHGSITLDEIAGIQPGMARLMDEIARRYWTLYYAARAGNWDLARYMVQETEKILSAAAVVRPKYASDVEVFLREQLGPIAAAIESRDWEAFAAAYQRGIDASDTYHDKYNKGFLRFRLPNHPPEWFEFAPR